MLTRLNPKGVEEITLHGFLTATQSISSMLERLTGSLRSCSLDQIGFGDKKIWYKTLEVLSQGSSLRSLKMNTMLATACAVENEVGAWILFIGNVTYPFEYRWELWEEDDPPKCWGWVVPRKLELPRSVFDKFKKEHKARMSWWSWSSS